MNKRKKFLLAGTVALIIILVLIRGPLLRMYVSGKTKQLEDRYSLIVTYDKLVLYGIAGVKIEGLTIYPKGEDTLFSADYVKLKMNPIKLIFLTPDIRKLDVKNMSVRFIKSDSTSNFDFLYKETKKENADSLASGSSESRLNYAKNTDYLLSLVLGILPARANIDKLDISYINRGYNLHIHLPSLKVDKDKFETEITATENGASETLKAEGVLDDSERKISTRIYSRDSGKFSVPFLEYRWGAKVQFDTLAFEIAGSARKNDEIHISGKAVAKGVSVFHERLSPENVLLNNGRFDYKFNIGRNYFELDSSSVASVNNFSFSPYLKAEKAEKWHITASLNKPDFNSEELFSSLPKGLFYNLDGIKTKGTLNYHFYLNLDFSQVDSLKIESLLKPKNFKIISFGNTDLRKLNGSFEYTAYEKGIPVRSFIVGPENPNFRPLGKISQYLQIAVLQSEDGGFFYHNGFLIESIQEALAADIKKGKFVRGGSTISMQLVKNVFLSRHKTLARKFEEILIVWLIENNRLSSKERMFEVYLNIIEWGPGIYGINEASRFYFDKDPRDLTVNESIFLASIIPSPKRSLHSFTDELQLKPELEGYYRLIAQRLRVKGLITETEELSIRPEVHLAGEARKMRENMKNSLLPAPAPTDEED
jgi:hypothetical protein